MPSELQVLDYPTFGTDDEQMIDGFKAWYLFGTERLAGAMAPYVAAFSDEEAAAAAQEELGGELVDFAGMHELMLAAKSADEDGEEDVPESDMQDHQMSSDTAADTYVCSCTGGCCDHVKASEPGVCPQCGMELVKADS
jgi:hypothetical protein